MSGGTGDENDGSYLPRIVRDEDVSQEVARRTFFHPFKTKSSRRRTLLQRVVQSSKEYCNTIVFLMHTRATLHANVGGHPCGTRSKDRSLRDGLAGAVVSSCVDSTDERRRWLRGRAIARVSQSRAATARAAGRRRRYRHRQFLRPMSRRRSRVADSSQRGTCWRQTPRSCRGQAAS